MRLVVFFDLPVLTSKQRKEYRLFRKYLLQNGFMMLQESVYCRMVLNGKASDSVIRNLHQNAPPEGLVKMLGVTESQFAKMELVAGSFVNPLVDTDDFTVYI